MNLDPPTLAGLSATEAARRLAEGEFSSVDYARALLARVDQVESQVQAWAHLDPAYLLAQAEAADHSRALGQPTGPLFGVPVGIKDIIDTADLPTEDGTVLHAGRQPGEDAALVRRLRAAGGLVMGKTVTTELATYAPGKTRNPHHPEHTAGGSSSGYEYIWVGRRSTLFRPSSGFVGTVPFGAIFIRVSMTSVAGVPLAS